jgi:hypothetical protein
MIAAHILSIDLLLEVLSGAPLDEAIRRMIPERGSPLLGHPFLRWMV